MSAQETIADVGIDVASGTYVYLVSQFDEVAGKYVNVKVGVPLALYNTLDAAQTGDPNEVMKELFGIVGGGG